MWVVGIMFAAAACGRVDFDPLAAPALDGSVMGSCVADPHLVACYAFEGNALDSTTNANHATATSVSYTAGIVGQAILLDATSVVRRPDTTSLDFTAGLTAEAWIRLDQPAANPASFVVDHNGGWGMYVAQSNLLTCGMVTDGVSAQLVTGSVSVGAWHHVACTYDGTVTVGYIDGMPEMSSPSSGALIVPSDLLQIGGNAPDGTDPNPDPLVGAIDELRIWNTARPASSICVDAMTC